MDKDFAQSLAIEVLRTAIVLFTLLMINRFLEALPFSGLPVFNSPVTAAELLSALVSAAAIAVFLRAGLNAKPAADGLFPWLPGAGTLLNYLAGLAALLFAYAGFQPVIFPFIRDLEWVYQCLFLAATLFLLAKAATHVYSASESVSRFLLSVFQPYKAAKPQQKSPAGDQGPP